MNPPCPDTGRIRFGWWTTGRDEAALSLFDTVTDAMRDGTIPGVLAYVFVSRDPKEGEWSDRILEKSMALGIPTVTLSAVRFEPVLRKRDREAWRVAYHREVLGRTGGFCADVVILAGYMWVVSPEACSHAALLNLHPAAPDGPAGTWQEVIWQLLEKGADRTGVMMHLVTPELDKGPPVTFCTFPVRGPGWDHLWEEFERERAGAGLDAIMKDMGEAQPLFARIRRQGLRRELPLIVETMRSLATGRIILSEGRVLDRSGREMPGPMDLTSEIEARIGQGGPACRN
ncbi:MAG: formyl transferase [Deltaproteobacteria bacterium]